MSELTTEEKFIIEKLKEHDGTLNYRELQTLCQEVSAVITLLRDGAP